MELYIVVAIVLLLAIIGAGVAYWSCRAAVARPPRRHQPRRRHRRTTAPTKTARPRTPTIDTPTVESPVVPAPAPVEVSAPPELEIPEPTAGRLVRLRARLSRSQNVLGKGPARAALPGPPRRRRLGGDRGQPDRRRRRRVDGHPGDRRAGCASGPGSLGTRTGRRTCAACSPTSSSPRSTRAWTARCDATPARRPPGGPAGRRRQRLRQDHHLRQDRPGADRRRAHRGARRGRHVPGRGRRSAGHLGRAGSAPRSSAGPRAATRRASRSTRSSGASRPGWTPC